MSEDEDIDNLKAQAAQDTSSYFEMLAEEEKKALPSKVVSIRPEINYGHTDTELQPMTLADSMFERVIFDPEQSLIAAAHESWILDDLIPAKGIGMIYGPPGSYKSFIALDMGACVATGKDWHGFECELPGGVMYIAAEGSRGIMERAVAWKKHYSMDIKNLIVLPVPVMFDQVLMVEAFTECLERAKEALDVPIRMVFIDTMARSFNGDENSAQEVGVFINACERFATDIGDCMVMVVTHTGKDLTRGMRGSSALDGAAYCHFMVTKPNDGQALVKNTKQKDIEMAPDMRFTMESVSTGIADRKDRIRRSLVPILESTGDMADPDAEEVTAFDHKDANALVAMVKAAAHEGRKISEDDLRSEFVAYMCAEGKKLDSAKRSWRRTYQRTREAGGIMKAGIYIYPGDK